MPDKKISAVIACYNEEDSIGEMHRRLTETLKGNAEDYEIIFVENGSFDRSYEILKGLAKKDRHVVVIRFSRNYQSQSAFTAGMQCATGDAVVCLDGDLQDPPEVIGEFIRAWQEGYDIVYGVRTKRRGSLFRRICYKAFYRVFRRIADIEVPVDAGDFSLMDRRVVNHINALPERDRFIRGLRAWVGFKNTGIPYTRDDRKHGDTTNSFIDNVKWANKAIYSFSKAPLELISHISLLMFFITLLAIPLQIISYFVFPGIPHGITTIIILILFISSIQLLCMSFLGGYIGRIFEEVKSKPNYIVTEVINSSNREFIKRYVEDYERKPQ
ncbi:MAG: glycosyltransferase [Candidatus Altiarchaeales archaeon]|nr:glycosyltransferase [Candidatus Altiarchaeales archaeon]MBD3415648.1 glycosyltransferase [Candidatus Altiarchaeales archaeon]